MYNSRLWLIFEIYSSPIESIRVWKKSASLTFVKEERMLKTDFQNDIQLHAVPLSRIKQFRDASQAEPMRTIIIKLDTRTVGPKVMKEIREMILGYGCDLTYLYD